MKKTIAIFGCSWTRGMPEEKFDSWVNYLADRHPQYNFYNLAVSGTSVSFQIHVMNEFKKIHAPDKIIFQLSAGNRFTYFDQFDLNNFIVDGARSNVKVINTAQLYEKVNYLIQGMVRNPDRYWIQDLGLKKKEAKLRNFATEYFTRANQEIADIELVALTEYVKSRVDFCYSHTNSPATGIAEIQRILGPDEFKRLSFDERHHFNKEGMEWLANWIDNQITL
jgi:hypothetical protein